MPSIGITKVDDARAAPAAERDSSGAGRRLPLRYRLGLSAIFAFLVLIPSGAAIAAPLYTVLIGALAFAWLGLSGLSSSSRYAASASLILQGLALCVARFIWALPGICCLAWMCFIALQCFLRYPGSVAYLYSSFVALSYLAGESRFLSAGDPVEAFAVVGAFALACVGMEAYRRCRAQLAAEKKKNSDSTAAAMALARANMELQKNAAQAELIAVFKERARLARDIHDTVGHALTSVILQIGAAQECSLAQAREGGPGERLPGEIGLDERLDRARETAREGLAQIRASIKDIAAPSVRMPKGRTLWHNVVAAFAKATGVRVVENFGDDLDDVPEELDETVFRLIQESMTNAVRHGDARDIEIAIKKIDGFLCVRVCDDGRGAAEVVAGQGLRGMRERIEALGGSVEWRTRLGYGFDLGADIPMENADAEAH